MKKRVSDKLTDVEVKKAKPKEKPWRLADGKGLYLEVMPNGAKYWRMKYRYGDKEKRLALGVYPETALKDARKTRDDARDQLANGIDPSDNRRQTKLAKVIAAGNTFEAIAMDWLERKKPKWSASHATRTGWLLEKHLFPWIGKRPIDEITNAEMLAVLRRIEQKGIIETAHRAKQTASQVFRYAIDASITTNNPAPVSDALKTPVVKHFPAITEPAELGKLLLAMDSYTGTPEVKTALLLTPMLFQRPSEIRRMEWAEINWEEERWDIPAEKMKMRVPHVVPFCRQALHLLREIQPLTGRGKYVFPSARGASRPLSENGVRTALRTLGYTNEQQTPHGFRATARTIMDEVLGYRVDLIEHQLAHAVKDANGRSYNRTTHLPARKEMMQGWADYLDELRAIARGDNVTHGNFRAG